MQDKNSLIASYKDASSYTKDLIFLRRNISDIKNKAYKKLNQLLLSEFERLQIKFEQATWDEAKNKEGKPIKRALTLEDIKSLQPFHWGYEFDVIFARGGFDAIITNPPWENFEPNGKEFFREYDSSFLKNKMTIKDYENQIRELLKNEEVKKSWLNYHSNYNHQRLFFRTATQYKNQVPIVGGKRQGKDVNLYKLFTEQCFNLLKKNGECGIVIPNGIYQDLGATDLRKLLFDETNITGLFCFENNKLIFEGVHRSFKFIVLTFVKNGKTEMFPAAFMRHEVNELANFPNEDSLKISTDLIKKSSPDSLSVMEFKNKTDIDITEKMLKFPLLGEQIENTWKFEIHREFNLTDDAALFHIDKKENSLQLYEGKMIHQFEHKFSNPRYWIDEEEGRKAILGRQEENNQLLDYQGYRLGFREVAASTNQRTMIATLLPRNIFTCYTVTTSSQPLDVCELLLIVALLNSFVVDFIVRQKVTCHCTMYLIYQLPIPRLTEKDPQFKPIVERAAALICTTPEFDDLRAELLESKIAILDSDKQQLRAELDAIIAHLYGLTESEFAHILKTFPIVKEEVKAAAMVEFKKLAVGEQ